MKTITTTTELAAFCARAATFPYVTVDTEFLRERTYYSKLCLVQLAFAGGGEGGCSTGRSACRWYGFDAAV